MITTRITTNAAETSEIITALLLLSRAPEKLDAPLTSINAIVTNEVERLSYLLRFNPVVCDIHASQELKANVRPELLKMALGNLIKNAFQYTDEGEVTVTIDQQTIKVADYGIEIPNEMMPLLFERFERGSSNLISNNDVEPGLTTMDSAVEGSWLGLSIVQRIMTYLDWTLTHETNDQVGSTFIIHYR